MSISNPSTEFDFQKLSPSAIPLEEAILGAIMLDRSAFYIASGILDRSAFYLDAHQLIFDSMLRLADRQSPIDLLTLMDQLKKDKNLDAIGGASYLAELSNKVASAANIEYHCLVVVQKAMKRHCATIAVKINQMAHDPSVDDLEVVDFAEQALVELTGRFAGNGYKSASSLVDDSLADREEMRNSSSNLLGIPSGFPALDKVLLGFRNGKLYILAARPGMGKSAGVTTMIKNQSVNGGYKAGLISLEMSGVENVTRIVAAEAGVSADIVNDPKKETHPYQGPAIDVAFEHVSKATFFIDDTPGLSCSKLKSKARKMVIEEGVQILYIDYLQLMSGSGKYSGNRENEVSEISRSLKALAAELNIPIIALSQLNRSVETRGGMKRPQLSDLRESGSLEQDANVVIFLYQPGYYGITEDESGEALLPGLTEWIISKNRGGPLATVFLQFIGYLTMFRSITGDDEDQIFSDAITKNDAVVESLISKSSPSAEERELWNPKVHPMNVEGDIPF